MHLIFGIPDPTPPTEYAGTEHPRGAERYWRTRYRAYLPGGAVLTKDAIEKALRKQEDSRGRSATQPLVQGFSLKDIRRPAQFAIWDMAEFTSIDRRAKRLRLTRPVYQAVTEGRATLPAVDARSLSLLVIDDLGLSFRSDPTIQNTDRTAEDDELLKLLDQLTTRAASNSHAAPEQDFLIFTSVANNLPDLDRGIWRRLYSCAALRDRTIVILDADDLRYENFRISTAVSWERTSQNLVTELRSNPRLIPFTRFRHLIVRFGITGALHAHRNERQAEPRFTLHFDPNWDDAAFTDLESHGIVLGYSAIHAAYLAKSRFAARELTQFDLNIGTAIIEAISRCQLLYNWGYGASQKEVLRMLEAGSLPTEVFEQSLPAKRVASSRYPDSFISESTVPLIEMSEWDILSQSASGRIREIAEDIVLFGVGQVLNQPRLDIVGLKCSFCSTLIKTLSKKVQDSADIFNALPMRHILQDYKKAISRLNLGYPPTLADGLSTKNSTTDVTELIEAIEDLWNIAITSWLSTFDVFGNRPTEVRRDVAIFLLRALCGDPSAPVDVSRCHRFLRWPPFLIGQFLLESIIDLLPTIADKTKVEKQLSQMYQKSLLLDQLFFTELDDAFPGLRSVTAPIAWFEQFSAAGESIRRFPILDRREVEGYRTIRNLIRRHFDQLTKGQSDRPLSIGVFGPPGSGKSSAIWNIVHSAASENQKIKILQFNLAQFVSTKELDDAFEKIVDALAKHHIPIAFFDEFDARFASEELGWLKYFLAPMEDGEFKGHPVGDAIMVFAGGTSETFYAFSRSGRATTDKEWLEFRRAKGPDFVSRLSGHLDILGINPTDNSDNLYLIRRAVMLRSRLEGMQSLDRNGVPMIDRDLLRALLHVPVYKHGGRSLRMALDLVSDGQGHIRKSYIPSLGQLNMHLDAKAFLDCLNA